VSLYLPYLGQLEFGCSHRTGEFENDPVLEIAGNSACKLLYAFRTKGSQILRCQPVADGIEAGALFSGYGFWPGAVAGVAPVGSDLFFARHRLDRASVVRRFKARHIIPYQDLIGLRLDLQGQALSIFRDAAKRLGKPLFH
jgi:hypothetical protein